MKRGKDKNNPKKDEHTDQEENDASRNIKNKPIKTAEFPYNDYIKELEKILKDKSTISLKELIKKTRTPTVHYGKKGCPKKCKHKRTCYRVSYPETALLPPEKRVVKSFTKSCWTLFGT